MLSLDHFISTANARCSLRPCTRAPHDDTTNPISPRLYGETKLQMGDQDDRRVGQRQDHDGGVFSSITMKQVSGRIMSSRNYVAKDISLGIRPQAAMLEGVFEVAQAVRVTMGPSIYKNL
ncbi:hypothetical protein F2Q68_00006812 [Brassica cretica]|uniref:Uncharacterized protein n=1 Tax=Brassica cretica TaxID=69181 RepID=A0A8S9JL10_BRACR|nr:hypothetical protein F2Q68_00006812 [Brassica cretica]